ncbi:uncharacterized protein LOC122301772 [Carya illinoinensis]|uniref:uncharacterized protein LOC122301772 n=1 Tax=Carya illinoinensis TaxID=32201 RepID=UPI001C7259BD|nr:uncharacterized protein LOC122301772 [Carya illinoinensis]
MWWASYQFTGTPSFILAGKLKVLKNDLRKWNLEVFRNINDQQNKLFMELQQFDEKEVERTLLDNDRARKLTVVTELEKVTTMEEIMWRQKSRALWLKEWDRSTKFFHRIANSHRRNNVIEVLHTDGRVLLGRDVIKERIVQFYEKLLTEQYTWRPKVDGLAFDSIDHSSAAWLERPFDENESLNASFITLIPKRVRLVKVNDFRPISSISGVYKIISKVLVKRLSEVLEKIILKSQNAFVKGRYDFGERWCQWIKHCITIARFSVLVNGTPEGFFNSCRGLRQGDPISPLLFILVMDVLIRMLRRAVEGGFLSGFTVGGSTHASLTVSHLLFANDTLIFCDPDQEQFLSL